MPELKSKIKVVKSNTEDVLRDYKLALLSRESSLMGRKEVFMGKAKFGIFGDGKEIPQLAMSKVFKEGDFRAGYYRDQTFMMAIDQLTAQQFFAQLYANTSVEEEPASAGRSMNGHFGTRSLNEDGSWKDLTKIKNSSADISPTAGQMPRLLGLAYASKIYRENKKINKKNKFSKGGKEIAFGTIGNASTSEGMFYEAINAAGVLQVPMVIAVWDDEYGISVPKEYHTSGGSISEALAGFQRSKGRKGFEIIKVKGWDYNACIEAYKKAETFARNESVPVIIHFTELTQPQGHSTSGSHERYKSKERLEWEHEYDCLKQMRKWIIEEGISDEKSLKKFEEAAVKEAKTAKTDAWNSFVKSMEEDRNELIDTLNNLATESGNSECGEIANNLKKALNPTKLDSVKAAKAALRLVRGASYNSRSNVINWLDSKIDKYHDQYGSHLYSESSESALSVDSIKPVYDDEAKLLDGREIVQANFDKIFEKYPEVFAIGEDLGKIGDVNQGFAGLQEKYGVERITDTGIRECTILGQGIGAAMRGLRPIVEIQYLDYIYYAIQIMADDLANLQYRTKGGQKAPVIIRTRGHRLEGIWHSGSPIGMLLSSLRGVRVLVPRDMTQAAGFYNTMLKSDEPALIIECLNGYRLKEKLPSNIGEFTTPLGVPEILKEGNDVTIVTYGSMCRIVLDAAKELEKVGISLEVIDVQSLLPFDIHHSIVDSIKKTNRVIFADEDVPGGASAFMMQKLVEEQNAYQWLDSQPRTLSAKEHRPAYSSDGDYFSKPSSEDVFDLAYELMQEADPQNFPELY
jgi:pyruvate/2-oxoglutarate/acetoin dehydrogenase E1 component/TPP-dependent pyruvate/acetoin dehydrogenase alpha subunit